MTEWVTSYSWSLDDPAKRRMQAVMDKAVGDSCLDMGCRDGTFSLTLAQAHPQMRVIGADTDASAVAWANNKAIELGLDNATFFQVSVFDDFGPNTLGTFSTVVCMETLEHLPPNRVHEANDKLLKYLKSKGRLIITVPSGSHISDPDHHTKFYREMFHGGVTWITEMPLIWLGWYKDFGETK